MGQISAGVLVYRITGEGPRFLLAHPGGPFWAKRDDGAWTVPKGLVEEGEDVLAAARREFGEETGLRIDGDVQPLQPLKQKGGKVVHAFLAQADLDIGAFRSNLFEMPWPPRSGKIQAFPEVDRIGWFAPDQALRKILPGQAGFIGEAIGKLGL
jgi:predicted NUDIX family NTP pyrophosphohydrolase